MNKEEFYSIGRGNLNLNGKYYYGLDYEITNFMKNMENENTNLKQALNEIREYCNNPFNWKYTDHYLEKNDILQIIDKYMKEEK